MIQFLLSCQANTEGQGCIQYVQAIALAEKNHHPVAARLLRSHRELTQQDEYFMLMANLDEEESLGEDPSEKEQIFDMKEFLERASNHDREDTQSPLRFATPDITDDDDILQECYKPLIPEPMSK